MPRTTAPEPLEAVVGRLLKAWRDKNGLRLDEVAEYVRSAGLTKWTRQTVFSLEAGDRKIDLAEIWLVCAALGIGLAELLEEAPAGTLVATGVETWPISTVRDVLTRRRGLATSIGSVHEIQEKRRVEADLERDAADETVRRVARTLSEEKGYEIAPEVVARFAWSRWGRSLPDERDARVASRAEKGASPRTLQALRGHVTRELVEKLREVVV